MQNSRRSTDTCRTAALGTVSSQRRAVGLRTCSTVSGGAYHGRARTRESLMRIAILLALLMSAPLVAQDLSPREIAAQARPSVVLITALNGETALGHGSGFFVRQDGLLVTNRHVIEGATALRVQLASGEIYDRVLFVSEDERRDIVVLRIPGVGLTPLKIADDREIQVGDPVYVVGNPLGLEGTFSDGLVSARRTLDGVVLIQITAPISPGSSGGPVLDTRGRVIGVATLSMREGQNLNLAVPARYAAGLIALNEPPQPFEQVASRFADPGTSLDDSSDLEPWARVLLNELERVREVADDHGLVRTHEAMWEGLDQGEEYAFRWRYSERGRDIILIGVCDSDCSDLDLTVRDPRGRVAGRDVSVTDRPTVDFVVGDPGLYEITVRMYTCDNEPCYFVVQSFAAPR
jgi:S1-C subfamily serine protease